MQHDFSESLITVLGVVYSHWKTADGGDLYLTRYGMRYAPLLHIENWYDPEWFFAHRERLNGTSAVYRVPTKPVNGKSLDLVVKNCRVGEDVPGDTQTLLEFLHAEFNSPWEEFSLTTELRAGRFGNPGISIQTQLPLAIYVPSETMQPWQSGRSRDRLIRVTLRHPGVDIDILKQYKLVYGWIHGNDLVECLHFLEVSEDDLLKYCIRFTARSIETLAHKGFAVADMKPSHIIVGDSDVKKMKQLHLSGGNGIAFLEQLINTVRYSVIDYELLIRTPDHDEEIHERRRQLYLDVQKDRFSYAPLPPYLRPTTVMQVPYVYGHSESTDGRLWVVGRNGELFDYFLPERWRRTHSWALSQHTDIYYTLTKDHIHLVWKTSRVGETPQPTSDHPNPKGVIAHGYNSPFEEVAIAQDFADKGIGAVYMRAIYRTGSKRVVTTTDNRRYRSHEKLLSPDGVPVLARDYNYITLRGYFNGSDAWVASHSSSLCRPLNLAAAMATECISLSLAEELKEEMLQRIYKAGYDGELLLNDDFLLTMTPENKLLETDNGRIDIRVCNFELIRCRFQHHLCDSMP